MDDKLLTKLADSAGRAAGADAVYLFGSRVNGTATRDSDYDFALLLRDGSDPWQAMAAAQRALWPRTVPVDLIPVTRSEWSNASSRLVRDIKKNGSLIYCKNG